MPTLIHPIVAITAGIIILIYPKILNYVVGVYLVLSGILGFLAAK